MSRLLIIGASILQLPAILKAKEEGHYVAVADYNPKAVGVSHADEYFNASTIDIEAIVGVARRFRPDGIMTLATDMPMRSIAAATTALGLPGISMETAIKATDKGEMIKAFKAFGVESPWYYILYEQGQLEDVKPKLSYPCITKPTDNAGSRGVILVNNEAELEKAVTYSSNAGRSGTVIIEEYMTGHEVSVEMMIVDSSVHVLAITDKLTTGAPHFVELGHNQPSILPETVQDKIKDLAIRAVKSIGLTNGPAHVEIMLTHNGPKMVELGARMGGDCITTHLVPLSTGIDMIKATIDISLGRTPDILKRFHKSSAIRFITPAPGTVVEIKGIHSAEKYPGVKEVMVSISPGDAVSDIKSSIDRCGYVITQGENAKDAIQKCEIAKEYINIITQ